MYITELIFWTTTFLIVLIFPHSLCRKFRRPCLQFSFALCTFCIFNAAVVAYRLHKSFITLAFLHVDCRAEVVTSLMCEVCQRVWGGLGGSKQNGFGCFLSCCLNPGWNNSQLQSGFNFSTGYVTENSTFSH